MSMTSLVFRVDKSLKTRFQDFAWQRRISSSELLRQIVEDFLTKKEGKKAEVQEDHSEVRF